MAAEFASKIRGKFNRRKSSAAGIPSLLSRSSIRSSTSHGSSLFSPRSLRSHSSGHKADGDGESEGHGEGHARSRAGSSSRISAFDSPGGTPDSQPIDEHGPDDDGFGGPKHRAVITVGQAEADEGHQQPRSPDSRHADASADVDDHDHDQNQDHDLDVQRETANGDLISPEQNSSIGATDGNPLENDASSNPNGDKTIDIDININVADMDADAEEPTAGALTLDAPATATAVPAPPGASGTDAQDDDSAAAPAPAPTPAPAPATPTPTPSTLATPSAAAAAAAPSGSGLLKCSADRSGNDLHSPLRKLPSINEQPSPDAVDGDDQDQTLQLAPPQQQPPPPPPPPQQPPPQVDATHGLLSPATIVTPAEPGFGASAGKKQDLKPAEPVRPRTPKLGPLTAGRPFHIPLPPASFGGPPSPSRLSPNGTYSAISATAPSSPLGRYSTTAGPPSASRPAPPIRRQSLLSNRQSTLIQTLLRGSQPEDTNAINADSLLPISGNMVTRKIWVKRPGASATLVTINEDDMVDDVRDMILRKYANSLGRQFDSPDLTLRIKPGGNQQERMLGPEEPMARTLDAYFPSGQTIDDALIIDVPPRRTPRASPRAGPPHAPHVQYYVEDPRPPETSNDYFGPGAVSALPVTVTAPSNGSSHPHAMSVISTGQVPQIPSPGGSRARNYRERPERPRLGRQHTSSPTLINLASGATHQGSIAPAAAPVPTHDPSQQAQANPPAMSTPPAAGVDATAPQRVVTPPPRVASPRPSAKAKKKKNVDHPSLPKGMLNGSVPPINVLIVEDNIINLKLLEAFVKRLKVRWSTAMNGRDAVNKWRGGGFHLVLMDIQLPVMSGLDATREIRRLERVNSIGVFSSAAATAPEEVKGDPDEKDKLENMDLFKSPVIIVALTASSLQSDRHEALAAGCNDFLTKPVNFVWLERKVMEWGCMQALIDFDGWRKWKDFSPANDDKAKAAAQKAKNKKNRASITQAVTATA